MMEALVMDRDGSIKELQGQIKQALATLPKSDNNQVEEEVNEDDVVCKLYLKGYPRALMTVVDEILAKLVVKYPNGTDNLTMTNKYAMTLMVEKVKKD